MATLHIENRVHDYNTWREAFDKFEAFRAEKGVRAYRISRSFADAQRLFVDLDFDTVAEATEFQASLEKIWRTPQSEAQLISHGTPEVLDVVTSRTLTPAG